MGWLQVTEIMRCIMALDAACWADRPHASALRFVLDSIRSHVGLVRSPSKRGNFDFVSFTISRLLSGIVSGPYCPVLHS